MSFAYLYQEVFSCTSTLWPWVAGVLANATLLLVGLAGANRLITRRNPPLRHMVASLGLGCLIALPPLSLLLSRGTGLSLSLRNPSTVVTEMLPLVQPSFMGGADVATVLAMTWGLGATLLLSRLRFDLLLLRWQTRRGAVAPEPWNRRARRLAHLVGVSRPVRLLLTDAIDIPCTWGFRRPVILLPRRALGWRAERRNAVLLHELGHVRRHDGLTALFSRIACALDWFHPGAWWMERAAREEAERACDQVVIETGLAPGRYARHMLQIIRDARWPGRALAPSMAAGSHLARRIAALLDPSPVRSRLSTTACATLPPVVIAVAILLAAVTGPAAAVPAAGPADRFDGLGCAGGALQTDSSLDPLLNESPPEEPPLFTPAGGY